MWLFSLDVVKALPILYFSTNAIMKQLFFSESWILFGFLLHSNSMYPVYSGSRVEAVARGE